MSGRKYSLITFAITFLLLTAFAVPTIIVDPYFHYHKPIKDLEYPIDNQRYQNDGMLKNFSYDAIIIGTSMTLNFKEEEFNELFDVNSLHVSFLGGSYKEINNNIMTALRHNPDMRLVLRGLDISFLDCDKDYMKYEESQYPQYLYNENPFDDVKYFLNKEIFHLSMDILKKSKDVDTQEKSDEIGIPDGYSKQNVLDSFERVPISEEVVEFKPEDREKILANVRQNITSSAEAYPKVTFYLFLTPYSICYWDEINRQGKLNYMLEAEKIAIEEMLKYENIKLFSFASNTEMICNLDNYGDQGHYSPAINSEILKWMKNGEYELTENNCMSYVQNMKEFLSTYDYEAIYR